MSYLEAIAQQKREIVESFGCDAELNRMFSDIEPGIDFTTFIARCTDNEVMTLARWFFWQEYDRLYYRFEKMLYHCDESYDEFYKDVLRVAERKAVKYFRGLSEDRWLASIENRG